MSSKLMLESFRTVWSIPALGYLIVVWMKETVVGRRNKNQFTRKKGKKDNYCRWSVDIKSFEYTGFKQQWIMTIYIVLYNKGIQIINISLCRVEMISIQIFHLCDKLLLENGFFITKHWMFPPRVNSYLLTSTLHTLWNYTYFHNYYTYLLTTLESAWCGACTNLTRT